MVLKMVDLGQDWKSLETLWNASYMLGKCPKLAVFEKKPGLKMADLGQGWKSLARKCVSSCFGSCLCRENGGFGSGGEIAPNSLKRFLYATCFRECMCRFWVNSQGSEIGRFWAKTLGYSPWFWKWRIWIRTGNRSKLSETLPICSEMRC